MKLIHLGDGYYIPQAETPAEQIVLDAHSIQKHLFIGTDGLMREYDGITQEIKIVSPYL